MFQCDPGFVPEGVMTAVCGSDGHWSPNPGGVTCSPTPIPTATQTSILTPSSATDPTRPGESEILLLSNPSANIYELAALVTITLLLSYRLY